MARQLGIGEVIVPPASGTASALGFLLAPVGVDLARSLPGLLEDLDRDIVNRTLDELEAEGRRQRAEGATREYGVLVGPNGRIARAASEELRRQAIPEPAAAQ